ncbi:MAG: ATP-binding cassette domain-containing protein [Solirubrobacterales bacterium]|nr:ATP-binding cassette domain-containing protein [Solirubrobacterales bacterium]
MTQAIIAHELVKTYPGEVRALDGLSLSADSGMIFALAGPNGAGKSTTFKILTTLSRPDTGSARVAGIDVLRQPERVRQAIGVVGQKTGATPEATGSENLVMQGEIYGLSGRALRQRVNQLLDRFDLREAADRPTKTFSGGMRRRLDVALGLVHRPQVLFLDEPTTGLDPDARASLWLEIERLAGDGAMTILLTTHYLDEADRLADHLAIVDRGRIVTQGPPETLKRELRGDAIQLELEAAPSDGRVTAALLALPGLSEILADGRIVRARAEHGASAIPGLLGALEREGFAVSSVTLARPSLDDVYLRHTGHLYTKHDERE